MDEREKERLLGFLYEAVEEEEADRRADPYVGFRRRRIFTPAVTIWLMIRQRMESGCSQSKIMDSVAGRKVLVNHFEGKEISRNTGGFSQARGRLTVAEVEAVADRLDAEITKLRSAATICNRKVFLIDGTTFSLPRERGLLKKFPPCPARAKSKTARFPIAHVALAVDAYTGVASRPEIGAMYGAKAIHETKLALPVMQRLPKGSVIIGDRGFGSISIAYYAQQSGQDVILRMNKSRVPWLCGGKKNPKNGEMPVLWKMSQSARAHNPDIPVEAQIEGRYIEVTVEPNGFQPFKLKLFTTLNLPIADVVRLYGLRWKVELDLRTLKHVIDLDTITSRSADMVTKELILGITSYNLVRNIIAYAAHQKNADPRKISFTRALNEILSTGEDVMFSETHVPLQAHITKMIETIPLLTIQDRKDRPPQPRKILTKNSAYPQMWGSRAQECRKLAKERMA